MGKRTKGTITVEIELESSGHRNPNYYMSMIEKKIKRLKCVRNSKIVDDSLAHDIVKPQKKDKIRELNDIRKIIKKAMPEDIDYDLEGKTSTMAFYLFFGGSFSGTISIDGGSMIVEDGFRMHKKRMRAIEIPMADPDFFDKFREAMKEYYKSKTGGII